MWHSYLCIIVKTMDALVTEKVILTSMLPANIIRTKLLIPQISDETLARKRLLDALDIGSSKRLTLICAPPGFGKTTLVSNWVLTNKHPTAWISLDTRDNTLHGFLSYIWEALAVFIPDQAAIMISGLSSEKKISSESHLVNLINAISEYIKPLTLVLDDYHTIDNQDIHAFIRLLIQDAPSNLNFMITSRSDPPMPLGRLRGKSELLELRSRDLAFTREEFEQFMRDSSIIHFNEEQLDKLYLKTEGWITGARLALLSISSNTDMPSFLENFGGTDRNIMDYLMEEVLDHLNDEIQTFVLKTSMLERLNHDLCDYVLNWTSSDRILEFLEKQNLFLTPLDNHRTWFRYHPLFSQILKHRQLSRNADEMATLHTRASQWFSEQGDISEAIYHAAEAKNESIIADLIKENGARMLQSARLVELSDWFTLLSEDRIKSDPELCIDMSWTQLLMGELTQARLYAQYASENSLPINDPENIPANLAAIEAYLALFSGQPTACISAAKRALDLFEQDEHSGISVVAFVLGNALSLVGQSQPALVAFEKAIYSAEEIQNIHIELPAKNAAASLTRLMGQLQNAQDRYEQILEHYSKTPTPPLPIATSYIGLGEIYLDHFDLPQALKYVSMGLEIADRWGNSEAKIHGYLAMTQVHIAKQKWEQADLSLKTVDDLLKQRNNQYHRLAQVHAVHVQLRLARSDVKAARAYLNQQNIGLSPQVLPHLLVDYLTELRVLLAEMDLDQALENTHQVRGMSEQSAKTMYVIELHLLQACVLSQLGKVEESKSSFKYALALASKEWVLRPFIEVGTLLNELISNMGKTSDSHQSKFLSRLSLEISSTKILETDSGLVEKLSPREMEVLRHLVGGLSNDELAKTLFVSLSTVKTHLLHIYAKLDVKNRTAAIDRARKLGLV